MQKLVLGIVGSVLVGAASFVAYKQSNKDGLPVKTTTVEYGPVTAFVSATGNVINREELTVNSPIAAQIAGVRVKEGDVVRQGQLLAAFDSRESAVQIDMANATLKLAEQNAADARQDWERLEQVFMVGGEARKTVDDAKLRWQTMQHKLQLAQQELRQARLQHEKLQITAPAASTITARPARAGAWVKVGDPLFKLAPAGGREIEVKLDAGDSAAAVVGKVATVTTDAYPGREWQEKVTWVAPAANKEGGANTLNVRISVGPDAPPLVLGQQAEVKIVSASIDKALKISPSAIISKQGKPMVATIKNGRVHLISIAIGIESVTATEVRRGLNAGQQIILPEGKVLREDDSVSVVVDPAAL